MRFGLELVDVGEIVKESDFKVFADTAKEGGMIKAINVKGGAPRVPFKSL
jgi:aspartyl-tRNA synthetase